MTVISDLSQDLVEEVLSRVGMTSLGAVRCTCRIWNSLFKDQSLTKKHYYEKAIKESLVVMMYEFRACLTSINRHGTHNNKYLVDPSIKRLGKLKQLQFSQVFHCNGLLLCMTRENSKLMLWNPYLGQVWWIEPRSSSQGPYASFVIGYDSNNHYKILQFDPQKFEIYDFKSYSWRVLDIASDRATLFSSQSVSLKGNLYFFVSERIVDIERVEEEEHLDVVLLSFDFTRERCGPPLQLPFISYNNFRPVILSVVREEQLALLHQSRYTCEIEIWITTKIEVNAVSWSNFLKVDMKPFTGMFMFSFGSFIFVDEKEKVAVIFDEDRNKKTDYKAYVIGEEGYYKEVNLGESKGRQLVCSYVPSMVQIQQGLGARRGKRKQRDY